MKRTRRFLVVSGIIMAMIVTGKVGESMASTGTHPPTGLAQKMQPGLAWATTAVAIGRGTSASPTTTSPRGIYATASGAQLTTVLYCALAMHERR